MQQTVIMDLFWTCSSNERGSRAHNQDGAKALYLIPICASTVSYPPTLDLHLASVGISYRKVRRSCTCTSARFHSQTHGLYSEAPVSSLPSAYSFNAAQPSGVYVSGLSTSFGASSDAANPSSSSFSSSNKAVVYIQPKPTRLQAQNPARRPACSCLKVVLEAFSR
jgi:hypothetical protein